MSEEISFPSFPFPYQRETDDCVFNDDKIDDSNFEVIKISPDEYFKAKAKRIALNKKLRNERRRMKRPWIQANPKVNMDSVENN